MDTSQKSAGFLSLAPLKRRFCSLSARRLRADVVPSTNNNASITFDLPEPFGPHITLKPAGNGIVTRFANDLKPCIVMRSRRTIIYPSSYFLIRRNQAIFLEHRRKTRFFCLFHPSFPCFPFLLLWSFHHLSYTMHTLHVMYIKYTKFPIIF